jgi:hypothetical protein
MTSKASLPVLLLASVTTVALAYASWRKFGAGRKSRDEDGEYPDVIHELPVIDLCFDLGKKVDPVSYKEECKKVAKAFHDYGIVIVKDPRVSQADNEVFLDTMERCPT